MVNAVYRRKEVLDAIKKAWKKEKSVALQNILDPAELQEIAKETRIGWKRSYIPDRHSYEEKWLEIPTRSFVKEVTGRLPLKATSKRFSHRDYTILHDKEREQQGILAFLLLEDWNPEWGGKIVFMQNGRTLHEFFPRRNTLLIVERKKGVRYFIKYVNHRAGKRRLMILA